MRNSRQSVRNRRPQGSPNYKIRRIIALVVVVVLVVLVWAGISAIVSGVQLMFGGNSAPTSTSSPQASAGANCNAKDLTVTAIVANAAGSSQSSFDSGANPYFGYQITNNSGTACTFDLGPINTFFTVTSGSETIWDSHNCDRTSLTSAPIEIAAGETKTAPVGEWFRVYSSGSGCGVDQNPVTGGGASYHLTAEVNGVKSKDTVQFILN